MGFGPQDAPGPNIPVGTPGANMLRQYGDVEQVLATPNLAAVASATGGAAGVSKENSSGTVGYVLFYPTVSNTGNVVIKFPGGNPPNGLFWSWDQAFGTVTVTPNGSGQYTISWTAATMIPGRSVPYRITFQWLTEK